MACEVKYKGSVEKDFKKLPRREIEKILERIESDLAENPGKDKQLSGKYEGLYSYRVGDYRVIYALLAEVILVLRIAHRKEVYK